MHKVSSLKILLLLSIVVFILSSSASADCYTDCMSGSGCLYSRSDENVSYCSGTQARCSTECRNEKRKSYGAIAYSVKDEAYGWSHSWDDQTKAEKVALENCKQNGSGCEIWVWFYNSCGAIAADGETVAWGQDDSEVVARDSAMEKCKKEGGAKCEIKVSHCSH